MRLEPFVFQWAAAELLRSDDFVKPCLANRFDSRYKTQPRAIDQEFNCELKQFKAAILPPEDTNRTGDTNRTEADVDIRTGSGFINYINGYVSAGDTHIPRQ